MADAADVRRRVLSDCRHDVASGRLRTPAARAAVDAERGARAALLLRIGLGGGHRTTGAVVPVEGPAGHTNWRRGQADCLRRHPGGGRTHVAAGRVATY